MARRSLPAVSRSPVLGIDVSRFQGRIDWDRVAAATILNPVTRRQERVRFAFIRASGGGWIDANFAYNWREAKRVGILRGPYVAITAAAHEETAGGPIEDAAVYYDALRRALEAGGGYGPLDLEPMLDHEKGQADAPTDDESRLNVATVEAIADMIARGMGRRAGIYSGAYWEWEVPRDIQAKLSHLPLWSPDYRPINGFPWDLRVPTGWRKWYFRQFTSRGTIAGIPSSAGGHLDVNLYDGGMFALRLHAARSHLTGRNLIGGLLALSVLVVFLALMRPELILAVTRG